jgi:repressor LexA
MWEISPGQDCLRGIFLEFPRWGRPCDISHVPNRPDIAAIRDSIEREMIAKGFTKRSLSLRAGLGPTAVRDVLERTDNPGIGTLHKIAEALELPVGSLNGMSGQVPMIGNIGAGGLIAYLADDQEPATVAHPPTPQRNIVAFEVSGDSMLPKYEARDIIYISREHDGVLKGYLDRYCAVHLADGGTYLKILTRGTRPDRFTLRSLNAADMVDVEVLWASPVLFVMPANAEITAAPTSPV